MAAQVDRSGNEEVRRKSQDPGGPPPILRSLLLPGYSVPCLVLCRLEQGNSPYVTLSKRGVRTSVYSAGIRIPSTTQRTVFRSTALLPGSVGTVESVLVPTVRAHRFRQHQIACYRRYSWTLLYATTSNPCDVNQGWGRLSSSFGRLERLKRERQRRVHSSSRRSRPPDRPNPNQPLGPSRSR